MMVCPEVELVPSHAKGTEVTEHATVGKLAGDPYFSRYAFILSDYE